VQWPKLYDITTEGVPCEELAGAKSASKPARTCWEDADLIRSTDKGPCGQVATTLTGASPDEATVADEATVPAAPAFGVANDIENVPGMASTVTGQSGAGHTPAGKDKYHASTVALAGDDGAIATRAGTATRTTRARPSMERAPPKLRCNRLVICGALLPVAWGAPGGAGLVANSSPTGRCRR